MTDVGVEHRFSWIFWQCDERFGGVNFNRHHFLNGFVKALIRLP